MTVGFDLGAPAVTPRDAATVVLVRDGEDGLELFFVKRRADIRFMGGAYVFPGGKLDAEDSSPTIQADLDDPQCRERLREPDNANARALFVAAARECLEESGVLFADHALTDAALEEMRRALDVEHQPFGQVLSARGLSLRLSSLRPLARWLTPKGETRRFDARFFIAAAPRGARASHDTRETVDSVWLSPREAIARAHRGEIVLVPPTYRTVEQCARAGTVDEALALALAPDALPTLEPHARARGAGYEILLPDDPEHPECIPVESAQRSTSPLVSRFVYEDGRWTAVAP